MHLGDYRLSPAYDLLNSQIHIQDHDLHWIIGCCRSHLRKVKLCINFPCSPGRLVSPKKSSRELPSCCFPKRTRWKGSSLLPFSIPLPTALLAIVPVAITAIEKNITYDGYYLLADTENDISYHIFTFEYF
jgi:hypothetical protein